MAKQVILKEKNITMWGVQNSLVFERHLVLESWQDLSLQRGGYKV